MQVLSVQLCKLCIDSILLVNSSPRAYQNPRKTFLRNDVFLSFSTFVQLWKMQTVIHNITHIFNNKRESFLYDKQMNSYWSFLERKINLKREHIALGMLSTFSCYLPHYFIFWGMFGFLALCLVFCWGNDFLCNFIGFLYPAYAS